MKALQKRKVILHGELAKKFGQEHVLAVSSPAEAIRALCANFPDFFAFVSASEQRNVGYKVLVDNETMPALDAVGLPFAKTMEVVPVIGGAKNGLLGIVIGAALIGAAFLTGGASLAASGVAFSGLAGQVAFGLGVSMVLSGVSGMLAPAPKASAGAAEVTNKPSYTFNGPVNTTAQGNPVPLGYGRMIVGSAVISAGITADDYTAAGIE